VLILAHEFKPKPINKTIIKFSDSSAL